LKIVIEVFIDFLNTNMLTLTEHQVPSQRGWSGHEKSRNEQLVLVPILFATGASGAVALFPDER
jgi:hypothetical protein